MNEKLADKMAVACSEWQGDGLVDAPRLLELLFPNPACRPSLRWLRDQTSKRTVPFIRIGRLVFFDLAQVRAVLLKKSGKPCQ